MRCGCSPARRGRRSTRRRSERAAACVLLLGQCWLAPPAAASASTPDPAAGRYRGDQRTPARLEVRREADHYVVRLEGGSPNDLGAAAPAGCTVEARGALDGPVLRARFGAVETDETSYGAAEAEREGRTVEIAFAGGFAEVLAADTFGYCGLGTEFRGRYRRER